MEQVILQKLDKIQKDLTDYKIESMEMKIEMNETIHKMDTRMVKIETQFKIVVPAVTFVFVAIGGYIKKKFLSLVG